MKFENKLTNFTKIQNFEFFYEFEKRLANSKSSKFWKNVHEFEKGSQILNELKNLKRGSQMLKSSWIWKKVSWIQKKFTVVKKITVKFFHKFEKVHKIFRKF